MQTVNEDILVEKPPPIIPPREISEGEVNGDVNSSNLGAEKNHKEGEKENELSDDVGGKSGDGKDISTVPGILPRSGSPLFDVKEDKEVHKIN